ncbi:MAG: hypothetical protein CNE99_03460 [OM182 bacterium MED-G24]|uniref:Uncharacterized protein n=1 Tax=OM182 bacterium MED-G24 TaxID=1986255 RepID=A0A2A5WWC4_9GAMM|nr:MAG: hypothetical protein CNE99_03460 [OM182 bacterium MED-G24]
MRTPETTVWFHIGQRGHVAGIKHLTRLCHISHQVDCRLMLPDAKRNLIKGALAVRKTGNWV